MSYGMQGPTGKTGNVTPKGYKAGQLQQFTPEMMQLFSQLFSHVGPGSYLGRLAEGDESLFANMEAQGLKDLGQAQGQMASRFSGGGGGAGAMSSRRGSGFNLAQGQLSSDFAQQMQNQRQQMQMGAIQQLMQHSQMLLGQKPYETFLTKKAPGFWESLMSAFGENLGTIPQAAMQYYTGGAGAPIQGGSLNRQGF